MIGFLMMVGLVVGIGCGGDSNPFSSGKWKNSRECGGYSKEEVKEYWHEVVNARAEYPFVAKDFEREAEITRENGLLERAAELDCLAWLARKSE